MPRAVGEKPGGVPSTKPTFSWPGRRGDREVLRGVVASLSAAARGVSDTLPSNRAKCSLRGALRGGSAASGSACIGRRAGRYGESAALPRRAGAEHLPQNQPSLGPGGAGFGAVLRGAAAPLSAAARGVSDTLHGASAACSLRGALRGGSAASGSACIGRRAGRYGESAALPRWAEVKPGFPHVVRIRTDIFLRCGKCPRCRVRWGETGRSTFRETNLLLARAAPGTGKFCAGWPRHCPPPHAAFRTRCTRTVQRVRSEAHYAAAVPRLARSASGGEPCKTGERAALFLLCPRRRPLAPSAALC